MYITPDSLVYLIKNTKNDPNYQNTIYFTDRDQQAAYFQSKAYTVIDKMTYENKMKGRLRIGMPIGTIYGTSYMMFKNPSFENKWFYAFVTNYEYVNNDVTDVFFELDVIQTYLFDYILLQSMVERMSQPLSDAIGINIIPEGLDTGEYYYEEIADNHLLWTGDWQIVVFTTLNSTGAAQSTISGSIMGGLYSGLNYYAFNTDASGIAAVNNYLEQVSACGAESSVVSIVMIPKILMDNIGPSDATYTFSVDMTSTALGSYTPRNKKLLTSPYRGVYLTNGQGGVASYAAEYFTNSLLPEFTMHFSLGAVSDCLIQPIGYRGGARQYGLELTGFPQCAYTTDGYKAWMARNSGFLTIAQSELEKQNEYQAQAIGYQQSGLGIQKNISSLDFKNNQAAAQNALDSAKLSRMQANAGFGGYTTPLGFLKPQNYYYNETGTNPRGGPAGTLEYHNWNAESADIAISAANQSSGYNADLQQYINQNYSNQENQLNSQKAYINDMTALGIQKLAMQKHVASLTPPQFHGASVGSAAKQFGDFGYHAGKFRIREDYAQRIDDFFDMYGYAQNRIMAPYRNTRKHWTYLKTKGALFQNLNVPSAEMAAIQRLYDGGIRWWKDGDAIGGYYDPVTPGGTVLMNEDNTPISNPTL